MNPFKGNNKSVTVVQLSAIFRSVNCNPIFGDQILQFPGRSIIFTTHYLEEADVLADRKAVLARGRVEAEMKGDEKSAKMKLKDPSPP